MDEHHEGAMLQALWREARGELGAFGLSATSSYGEFLEFHTRFCAFQQRRRAAAAATGTAPSPAKLPGVALRLDKHRLGERSARRQGREGEWARQSDAVAQLAQAKLALEHFCEFSQKKQEKRRAQIANDRSLLPIADFHGAIVEAVRSNQVVVLAGDTGCGKSTQVPQFLLHCGCDRVVVTQPRRISAVSLTRRVALETNNEFGSQIAHQIRFDSSRTGSTRVVFMTEGVLLRQAVGDPQLSQYDVIVLDEVHERHISTDLLLGLLKGRVLPAAPNVRLVLMSATVNVQLFAKFFDAPVMQIPGRLHPITTEYCPPGNAEEIAARVGTTRRQPQLDPSPYLRLMQRIDREYPAAERGDALVFLGGMDDIARLCEAARGYAQLNGGWVVLPLHSSLAAEEQDRVFDVAPDGVRKLIVSTNIAETSVTIDGVRFVIDSGLEKEMRYDPSCGVRSLMVSFISKASAEQRKGRAGRTGPGVCFRLYSEKDFQDHFDDFGKPEVQRMNLDSTLLQILAQGQDPRDFPFIEPPAVEAMAAALETLEELGALVELEPEPEPVQAIVSHAAEQKEKETETETEKEPAAAKPPTGGGGGRLVCTALGAALSLLPVDLAAGKMLLLSTVFSDAAPALRSLVTIAAALSVQSPLQRRRAELSSAATAIEGSGADGSAAQQLRQASFDSPLGDPFTLLNCFDDWMGIKKGKAGNRVGGGRAGKGGGGGDTFKWCKRHGLQENRLYEMAKLQQQFEDMLRDHESGSRRDRRGRGGDAAARRQLRELQQAAERQRGRRVLRLDDGGGVEDEGDDTEDSGSLSMDVRRLDFELSYKLDVPAQTGRELAVKDCNLMKLVLAASLYPNLAIPDEHNSGKKPSDICFHTKHKKFVKLHPGCAASADPESACGPGELLCFTQLLETNKAYLLHPMPISALHALLLFAKSVHTDKGCTRIVCDGWLQLRLRNGGAGERLLLIAHQLRLLWDRLLQTKLRKRKPRPASKKSSAHDKQQPEDRAGAGFVVDRVGDADLAASADKTTPTAAEEASSDEDDDAHARQVMVPRLSPSVLAKLPRFAQHVYHMRTLPPLSDLESKVERPDELLADKLAAFMAVPIEFVVERAKLSELAVELGLRTATAEARDAAKEKYGGPTDGERAAKRQKNAKRRKKSDEPSGAEGRSAMQDLETASQLAGGGGGGLLKRNEPIPTRGHRLAAWLHYGSLRKTSQSGSGRAEGPLGGGAQEEEASTKEESASDLDEMRRFMGLSQAVAKEWRCRRCEVKMFVTMREARLHDSSCRVAMKTLGTVSTRAGADVGTIPISTALPGGERAVPPTRGLAFSTAAMKQLASREEPQELEEPQEPREVGTENSEEVLRVQGPCNCGSTVVGLCTCVIAQGPLQRQQEVVPAAAAAAAAAAATEEEEEEEVNRVPQPLAELSLCPEASGPAFAELETDERLADGKRFFLVRASSRDRKVGLRRSADLMDCEPDGSTGLLDDGTVVEAVCETKDWVQLSSGLWLPKEFLRSVETYENVLRYKR
jgi:HrpA-like RNA helicase